MLRTIQCTGHHIQNHTTHWTLHHNVPHYTPHQCRPQKTTPHCTPQHSTALHITAPTLSLLEAPVQTSSLTVLLPRSLPAFIVAPLSSVPELSCLYHCRVYTIRSFTLIHRNNTRMGPDMSNTDAIGHTSSELLPLLYL